MDGFVDLRANVEIWTNDDGSWVHANLKYLFSQVLTPVLTPSQRPWRAPLRFLIRLPVVFFLSLSFPLLLFFPLLLLCIYHVFACTHSLFPLFSLFFISIIEHYLKSAAFIFHIDSICTKVVRLFVRPRMFSYDILEMWVMYQGTIT